MPRKSYSSSAKKKYTKRRKLFKKRTSALPKQSITTLWYNNTLSPDKMRVKLKYHQSVPFTPAEGAYQEVAYRVNSVFDPYHGSGGYEALGHTQYSAFYQNYRVIKSTIRSRMTCSGSATASTMQGRMVTYCCASPTGITDIDDAIAQPYQVNQRTSFYEGSEAKWISMTMTPTKCFGVDDKAMWIDPNYSASVAADPVTCPFYLVGYQQDADGTGAVQIETEIYYYVEYFNRALIQYA